METTLGSQGALSPAMVGGLHAKTLEVMYGEGAFSRLDEQDDARFYARDRFVSHLDAAALSEVERIVGALVVEPRPEVLDLMASWNSHLPADLEAERVVGVGLNANELRANPRLDEWVIHDLNRDPRLPFEDGSFDVALSTVSVDYLTRPFEVFADIARLLRPGGLHLVVFSNRMFRDKAVRVWRESSEQERVLIVEDYFRGSGLYRPTSVWISPGRPRPADDKYAGLVENSDPVYAVWAEKRGREGAPGHRRRPPEPPPVPWDPQVVARRADRVGETLRCPYCDEPLAKWRVPLTPFTEIGSELLYICFNDGCGYLLAGFDAMSSQGNAGFSHRFMYDPDRRCCSCVPVPSLSALRESIVED